MNREISTRAPLINDYKRKFLFKRLLQTLLGGLVLYFGVEHSIPFYVYLFQIVQFVIPFVFGGVFILIADLTKYDRLNMSLIAGAIYLFFMLMFKIFSLIFINAKHFRKLKKEAEKNSKSKMNQKRRIRAEQNDEESYEFDSFCSLSALNFLFPYTNLFLSIVGNKLKLNKVRFLASIVRISIDSFLNGLLMFCCVYFLSLVYLQKFYPIGGAVCIFILNWIVLLIAFYSLAFRNPPEPAIFQPYDRFEIKHLTRAFYIFLFYVVEFIYNFASSNGNIPENVIFWLKIIMIFLPILWFFGTLPPIDAFFLWLFEQSLIHLYGGSAMSSNLKLIVQLTLAVCVSMAYFIPSDMAKVLIFSAFGYILASIDFVYLAECLVDVLAQKAKKRKVEPANAEFLVQEKRTEVKQICKKQLPFSIVDWIFHLTLFLLVLGCTFIIFFVFTQTNMEKQAAFNLENYLLYTGIGIYFICLILSNFQTVYLFFGLFRNPFYPKNTLSEQKFNKKGQLAINQNRRFFKTIKYVRLFLLRLVAPLLLSVIITIDCYVNKFNSTQSYWRTVCVLRAYRWIWQSTYSCLFEMACMAHLLIFAITYNSVDDNQVKSNIIQYFLTACLAASFVRDRFIQFAQKTFTFFLITITSWTIKKQKRKLALILLIVEMCLLPFVLLFILMTSLISASLLPLFTFPIYLIGFPRPKRFWPQRSNFFSYSTSNNTILSTQQPLKHESRMTNQKFSADSCFYAQIVPKMLDSFRELVISGSISIQPDTYFISRFQDRVIWIQIFESSHSYLILNVKGLELQETSCHTQEAQYVDDSFDLAFENPYGAASNISKNDKTNLRSIFKLNPNPFNCMLPKDILFFEAYSDAKNSLVGILDNPDSLISISHFYPKILHYFIVKHLLKSNENSIKSENKNNADPKISKLKEMEHELLDIKQTEVATSKENLQTEPINKKVNDFLEYEEEGKYETKTQETSMNESIQEKSNLFQVKKQEQRDDDNWSDDLSNEFDPKAASNTITSQRKPSRDMNESPVGSSNSNLFDFDIDEILGTSKSKSKKNEKSNKDSEKKKQKVPNSSPKHKQDNLMDEIKSNEFNRSEKNEEKNSSKLSLPTQWGLFFKENFSNVSVSENKEFQSLLMNKIWIEKLIEFLETHSLIGKLSDKEKILNQFSSDVWTSHYKFILKCCQTLSLNENNVKLNQNLQTIYKLYTGILPWTPINERLGKELPDLVKVIIKSFCFTIKMVIDNMTLSPISDDEEFFETLASYENEWFIGSENDSEFIQCILSNKPFIFSLSRDSNKKTLNSRTLSLQQIRSPLAQLNSEVVKAIWSSTSLELLYITNDDDERYSIQAHPYILRNLTIQSSDAPLGYCVYNSDNIYLSTLNPF